ncbi:MAG: monovalent cation/H(+) antiporter subunit G [Bacteroidales bacterium]|nr:monovalent cation/H(+) antiporter subunit G [Candidatus Latescibacterota bacterium]
MNETIGLIFLIIGITFDVIGCIGLVRLPDVYNRLQAATKCVTLGTSMILLAVVFYTGINSIGVKALLCIWFVLITSPTGAHAIARAAHKSGVRLWKGSVMDKYAEDNEGADSSS